MEFTFGFTIGFSIGFTIVFTRNYYGSAKDLLRISICICKVFTEALGMAGAGVPSTWNVLHQPIPFLPETVPPGLPIRGGDVC